MKGWAWSGGGRGISRVEVSADGHNWTLGVSIWEFATIIVNPRKLEHGF